ncbi:DUF433 domain-containing protein [Candidatus Woesearchaeota archaeon]|nr:DUF433 domain-containing protein [Candidatus Woesearchaeota archaeon]
MVTKERIVTDSDIMAGKPVIKGTRIPVDTIVNLFAKGVTEHEILEEYPNLTKDDIRAALDYAARRVRGEEIYPLFEDKKRYIEA